MTVGMIRNRNVCGRHRADNDLNGCTIHNSTHLARLQKYVPHRAPGIVTERGICLICPWSADGWKV